MQEDQEDTTPHIAVVNHEEQYSIWPADRPCPRAGARRQGGHARRMPELDRRSLDGHASAERQANDMNAGWRS